MRKNILQVVFSLLMIIIPGYAHSGFGGIHFYDIPAGYTETNILYELSSDRQYSLTCSTIGYSPIDNSMQIRLISENSDITDSFGRSKEFISPNSLIPLSVPYESYSQAVVYKLTNKTTATQHGICKFERVIKSDWYGNSYRGSTICTPPFLLAK